MGFRSLPNCSPLNLSFFVNLEKFWLVSVLDWKLRGPCSNLTCCTKFKRVKSYSHIEHKMPSLHKWALNLCFATFVNVSKYFQTLANEWLLHSMCVRFLLYCNEWAFKLNAFYWKRTLTAKTSRMLKNPKFALNLCVDVLSIIHISYFSGLTFLSILVTL